MANASQIANALLESLKTICDEHSVPMQDVLQVLFQHGLRNTVKDAVKKAVVDAC